MKARELYVSALFKKSWAYATQFNPDKIFILSALHGLLDPEREIDPYNVTLSYVPPKKRRNGLVVLNADEKRAWGKRVVASLQEEADLMNDEFIVFAGEEYIKPIQDDILKLINPLEGLRSGKRQQFLDKNILHG